MSITILKPRGALWRTALITLGVLLLAVIAFVAYAVRSPLPQTDGTLHVSGIHGETLIRRDDRGIPHILASSGEDAYFAEGFACAQDRLWQMDTLRRRAEGRLSEIVGPATLDLDRYVRILGLEASSRADYARWNAHDRKLIEAYAAGVNAAAQTHPLPLEFRLLSYRPAPWTPVDSLAIGKLMSQRLDDQWYIPKLRAALRDRLGAAPALALTDEQVSALEEYIPGYGPKSGVAERDAAWNDGRTKVRHTTFSSLEAKTFSHWANVQGLWREPDAGSNNWVAGPAKTTTGKPVLSNDTHLAHSLPSTWWIAQLQGPGLDVEGFTIPGIPGVVLGHNEHIAFGVTSSVENVQDLFVERFRSATSDEYLGNGVWRKAVHRLERIEIKGQPPEDLDVVVTRHGPIIERDGTRALALSWTILQNGGNTAVVDALDHARDWRSFRAALSQWVGPALNFGYADTNGHIGYQNGAAVPVRASGLGVYPVEGQDDKFAWQGHVPFDNLPHAFDPPGSIVATANNQLATGAFGLTLSTFWEAPFRVHRVRSLLLAASKVSPLEIGSYQADVYDYPRARLAAQTAKLLAASDNTALRKLAGQLAAWDGMVTASSRAPTFLYEEERLLVSDLLSAKLGDSFATYTEHFHPIIPLERVLDGDRRLTAAGITKATLNAAIVQAAREALGTLHVGARGLDDVPAWGPHNAAHYDHPLARGWPLDAILSPRPPDQPGDVFSLYAGRPTYGPSMRLVADLSDWDNSSMLLTLGESGQYSDEHYLDQLGDFTAVRWVRTPFTAAAVSAATRHTLRLVPR